MNKRTILTSFAIFASAFVMVANARRVTYNVNVNRPLDYTKASELVVPTSLLKSCYGYSSVSEITSALGNKTLILAATYNLSSGKESFYTSKTSDENYGHWFSKTGLATTKTANKMIEVEFNGSKFLVYHSTDNITAEGSYVAKESFISTTISDTITYVFNVTIGGTEESVTSDQQQIAWGRSNYTDSWLVEPMVKADDGRWIYKNYIQVNQGQNVTLSAKLPATTGKSARYAWLDKDGKTIRAFKTVPDFTLVQPADSDGGFYTLKARISMNDGTVVTKEYHYFVDVQSHPGEFYDWTKNTAKFSYNFRDEYPDLQVPEKLHNIKKQNGQPANCYAGEWWSVFWGDKLNPDCGMDSATVYDCAKNLCAYFDKEFGYIRDTMGWPPDLSPREGYKSYVYIFGSGLEFDNTDSLTAGGYQGAYYVDGKSYACVTCSHVPFSRFRSDADNIWGYSDSEWQRSAMVHEGIHAILANMAGVKGSAWFQEAGNVWLQGRMAVLRAQTAAEAEGKEYTESDDATAGWLDGCPFIAPFQPIECYSGWLQDGSFGGPSAEGVNRYNADGQICTWRRYLGGTQYGTSFPYILAAFCGDGSIPWIWRWCENRVLEGIGDYVGDKAMRKIVLQYRSRMSIYDFGIGSKGYRNVCNGNFGGVIGPEYEPYWIKCKDWAMTPYAKPTLNDNSGWLAPDTLTNPGWSGANFIPIHIDQNADTVCVEFRPEDTNMVAQLCYRMKDGTAFYSQPVNCGMVKLDITNKPANGVVILVVANTDYRYTGDEQRAHHWDYRVRLHDGAIAVADNYQRWYFHEQNITDPEYEAAIVGINNVKVDGETGLSRSNYSNAYFDMTGRQVEKPTKGIYIHNGKKIYVK